MKTNILYVLILAFVVFACEPIEVRDKLDAPLTEAEISQLIKIDVRASEAGGNQLIVENQSPYSGKWLLPMGGVSNRKIDTLVVFPTGVYEIEFMAATDGGLVSVKKSIDIQNVTHELTPPYSYLIGKFGEGVTWEYDKGNYPGSFWGMVADYNWEEFWWYPDYSGEDFDNEFTFKYDNGFVFIQDGVEGKFNYDVPSKTMTLKDPFLHMYDTGDYGGIPLEVAQEGKFEVKVLNENQLVLLQKYPAGYGYDWIWRLKRK